MHDAPAKFALTTAASIASGTASILSEHTLIPLGIFVVVSSFLVAAAWKVATAVTRATDRMERMDERIKVIEKALDI